MRRRAGDIPRAVIIRCSVPSIAAWVAAPADAPPSACVFLVAVTAAAVPAAFTLSVSDYLPGAGAVSLDLVSADGQRTRLGNFSGGTVRVDRTVAGRSVEMLEMSPL